MQKKIEDGDLLRLVSEERELANRLAGMRDRKGEHESALTKLDQTHWEVVRRIQDITEHLHRATNELRKVTDERTGRTGELRSLTADIKEVAKQLRTLRRRIQDSVGQDVCPGCGSTEIVPLTYGNPVADFDDDESSVNGGCCVNLDETVCCSDCGKHFLGNFDKWQRAQMDSSKPETVLEVGGEGSSLAIVRQRNQRRSWKYWCLRDERTVLGVLPKDELGEDFVLFEQSDHVDKFEDALLRLDRFPWFSFVPLKVSAEFADLVLREVERRGGKEAAVEWTEMLKGH